MKHLLAFTAVVVLLNICAVAQPQFSPKEMAKELQKSLQLNEEQTSKLEVIYATEKKSIDSLFAASNAEMDEVRKSVDMVVKKSDTEIEKILTDKQMDRYRQITMAGDGMGPEGDFNPGMMPPPPPPDGGPGGGGDMMPPPDNE